MRGRPSREGLGRPLRVAVPGSGVATVGGSAVVWPDPRSLLASDGGRAIGAAAALAGPPA